MVSPTSPPRRGVSHQAAAVIKAIRSRRLTVTPLASMTLDRDDVRVARHWLNGRERWSDAAVEAEYEREFARWNGSAHAFSFMGGRVALSACLDALDLEPGDEVVVPGYTCVAVANAARFAGLTPVFGDIELDTYGLDASSVATQIGPRTRVLLIQHLYGLVCRDYDALLDLAARRGLALIEDCAHATGAEHRGVKVGNRGQMAVYSSERSKVFNTIQGGMAVTSDDRLAARLRAYRERAPYPDPAWTERLLHNVFLDYRQLKDPERWWRADVEERLHGVARLAATTPEEVQGLRPPGYGCKMPAPVAALGLNQLAKIDRYNERRRGAVERWDGWCAERGYSRPTVVPASKPVFLRYPVLVAPALKQDPSWAAEELGVELGMWFESHLDPSALPVEGCPAAAVAVQRCVNLPCLGVA